MRGLNLAAESVHLKEIPGTPPGPGQSGVRASRRPGLRDPDRLLPSFTYQVACIHDPGLRSGLRAPGTRGLKDSQLHGEVVLDLFGGAG